MFKNAWEATSPPPLSAFSHAKALLCCRALISYVDHALLNTSEPVKASLPLGKWFSLTLVNTEFLPPLSACLCCAPAALVLVGQCRSQSELVSIQVLHDYWVLVFSADDCRRFFVSSAKSFNHCGAQHVVVTVLPFPSMTSWQTVVLLECAF